MMADGLDINLTGLDSLVAKMSAATEATRSQAGKNALRAAANIIRDRARSNAQQVDRPQTREAIYKNIVAAWSSRTFRQTGNLAFRVGVMGGARHYAPTKENIRKGRVGKIFKTNGNSTNPGGDTFYWRFLEFGTQHAKAQPILRPAMNGADMDVINVFATEFEKALDAAITQGNTGGNAT
jgi:HK97 gp10 family phage protein